MADNQQREGEVAETQREVPPSPTGAERTHTRPVYAPRTDIYETNEGLVLVVDLPGVRSEDTEITLEKRVLTIRGRAQDETPRGFSPVYREYVPGHFERMFTLSDEIDGERIEARQSEGVLRLFLPKTGPAQTKRIQIRSG
jgi:HSP20 family protein